MFDLPTFLFSGLPANANLAIQDIDDRIRRLRSSKDYVSSKHDRLIINLVEVWYKKYSGEVGWRFPNFDSTTSYGDDLTYLTQSIHQYVADLEIQLAIEKAASILDMEEKLRTHETFGVAVLSPSDKADARKHIERIREFIVSSDLPERKRVALLGRLSELELELESVGTRTDRFFAFLGDAAFALGDMAEKSKPFTDEVKQFMRIIFRARENTEGTRLPKGSEDLLLPPPEV